MQAQIRLNKYIASAGIASRRGADELIKNGKVKINGNVVTNPGTVITEEDTVEINGQKLKIQEKKYVIFNKPAGYITTRSDPHDRKTIYNILPPELYKLKPAGRLDKDSTGLIILTNDGELIQKLTHPKGLIPKVYKVVVEGKVSQQDLITLQKGIKIEKGKTAYAESTIINYEQGKTTLEVVLYQGYNRQIRRMMKYINHPVISLKRIAHANIVLTGLEKGKYRYLSRQEVNELYNYLKKTESAK